MTDIKPTIGFIGLEIMGTPMARNLLAAGYDLTVLDLLATPVEALVADGATAGATPAQVAADTDVLITMLPDSAQVEQVYLGPDGAYESLRAGWLTIDMSSIAPTTARVIAARVEAAGAEALDAPVSGGDKGAIAGTLSVVVGRSEAAYERARPILDVMGATIVHCGPAGAGQVVRSATRSWSASSSRQCPRRSCWGRRLGWIRRASPTCSRVAWPRPGVLEMRRDNFLTGSFDPGFRIRLHLKDPKNAIELARGAGAALPAAATVEQLMRAADANGRGDYDHSGLLTVLEDLAGARVADVNVAAGD